MGHITYSTPVSLSTILSNNFEPGLFWWNEQWSYGCQSLVKITLLNFPLFFKLLIGSIISEAPVTAKEPPSQKSF